MPMQCRGTAHTRRLTCVYAPWPQMETKEQKTAEAKTEEQETKGTKSKEQKPEVRPAPPSPTPIVSTPTAPPLQHTPTRPLILTPIDQSPTKTDVTAPAVLNLILTPNPPPGSNPQPRPRPTTQLRCRHLWPRAQPDQSPIHRASSPQPMPQRLLTRDSSPPADLAPQPALLEDATKSKPVTYAEACGAKSIAPPKRGSLKATTRLH